MPKYLLLILIFCLLSHFTVFSFANPEADLLKQHLDTHGHILVEDSTLTVIYEGEASSVEICCSMTEQLTRLDDSNIWVLRKTIPNVSKLVLSYTFVLDGGMPQDLPEIWRGPQAPKAPEERQPPIIRTLGHLLDSEILGESREIYVYLPPDHESLKWGFDLPVVYMADDTFVGSKPNYIEALITQGKLPPILLIATETGNDTEYLPGEDANFELHERFIIEEVLPWAEATYGASPDPKKRAVFGVFNGAIYAATMGLKNPDVFGYAMSFGLGINPTWLDPTLLPKGKQIDTSFYFLAGELEETVYQQTLDLSQQLVQENITSVFKSRVSGHDYLLRNEEFPAAVLWAFGLEEKAEE